MRVPVIIASY